MGSTLVSVDGVCVGVNALVIGVGPLHRDFDRHVLLFGLRLERDDFFVDDFRLLRNV